MTDRSVALCCAGILLTAAAAGAHPLAPALLEIVERSDRRLEVVWKEPIPRPVGSELAPVFPDACRVERPARARFEPSALRYDWTMDCGGRSLVGEPLRVSGLASSRANVLVRVAFPDGREAQQLLSGDTPEWIVPGRTPVPEIASRYLALGVEHLLTGVDHLLFVLGLMLLVAGPRALVASVTAFTLGHSVTLLLATLGWVRFPTQWVEVAIAGSLLVLAVGVVHRGSGAGRASLARHSWGMALGFGLLHGLGFAGALASVGLPESAIPLALLSFNLGIELGQLFFIAAVGTALLVSLRLPSLPWQRLRLVPAYAIGTLAAYWCFERSWPLF